MEKLYIRKNYSSVYDIKTVIKKFSLMKWGEGGIICTDSGEFNTNKESNSGIAILKLYSNNLEDLGKIHDPGEAMMTILGSTNECRLEPQEFVGDIWSMPADKDSMYDPWVAVIPLKVLYKMLS